MIIEWENIIAYLEEFKQSEGVSNKFGLYQIHLGGLWSQENLAIVTLKQNCDINMNISF